MVQMVIIMNVVEVLFRLDCGIMGECGWFVSYTWLYMVVIDGGYTWWLYMVIVGYTWL